MPANLWTRRLKSLTKNRGNIALVLIRNGEVIDEHYVGIQGEIGPENMTFQTASMSKWITANGVMKLAQEGSLDFDSADCWQPDAVATSTKRIWQ